MDVIADDPKYKGVTVSRKGLGSDSDSSQEDEEVWARAACCAGKGSANSPVANCAGWRFGVWRGGRQR